MGGEGGKGSPGAPQPAVKQKASRKAKNKKQSEGWLNVVSLAAVWLGICDRVVLEDVTAQILILYDVGELLVNVSGIDLY